MKWLLLVLSFSLIPTFGYSKETLSSIDHFEELPEELVFGILEQGDFRTLQTAFKLNHRFHRISQDKFLYESLAKNLTHYPRFPNQTEEEAKLSHLHMIDAHITYIQSRSSLFEQHVQEAIKLKDLDAIAYRVFDLDSPLELYGVRKKRKRSEREERDRLRAVLNETNYPEFIPHPQALMGPWVTLNRLDLNTPEGAKAGVEMIKKYGLRFNPNYMRYFLY